MPVNEYGQMIGEPVDDTPGVLPSLVRIEGRYTIIEALSVEKQQNVWALSMREPSVKLLFIKGVPETRIGCL